MVLPDRQYQPPVSLANFTQIPVRQGHEVFLLTPWERIAGGDPCWYDGAGARVVSEVIPQFVGNLVYARDSKGERRVFEQLPDGPSLHALLRTGELTPEHLRLYADYQRALAAAPVESQNELYLGDPRMRTARTPRDVMAIHLSFIAERWGITIEEFGDVFSRLGLPPNTPQRLTSFLDTDPALRLDEVPLHLVSGNPRLDRAILVAPGVVKVAGHRLLGHGYGEMEDARLHLLNAGLENRPDALAAYNEQRWPRQSPAEAALRVARTAHWRTTVEDPKRVANNTLRALRELRRNRQPAPHSITELVVALNSVYRTLDLAQPAITEDDVKHALVTVAFNGDGRPISRPPQRLTAPVFEALWPDDPYFADVARWGIEQQVRQARSDADALLESDRTSEKFKAELRRALDQPGILPFLVRDSDDPAVAFLNSPTSRLGSDQFQGIIAVAGLDPLSAAQWYAPSQRGHESLQLSALSRDPVAAREVLLDGIKRTRELVWHRTGQRGPAVLYDFDDSTSPIVPNGADMVGWCPDLLVGSAAPLLPSVHLAYREAAPQDRSALTRYQREQDLWLAERAARLRTHSGRLHARLSQELVDAQGARATFLRELASSSRRGGVDDSTMLLALRPNSAAVGLNLLGDLPRVGLVDRLTSDESYSDVRRVRAEGGALTEPTVLLLGSGHDPVESAVLLSAVENELRAIAGSRVPVGVSAPPSDASPRVKLSDPREPVLRQSWNVRHLAAATERAAAGHNHTNSLVSLGDGRKAWIRRELPRHSANPYDFPGNSLRVEATQLLELRQLGFTCFPEAYAFDPHPEDGGALIEHKDCLPVAEQWGVGSAIPPLVVRDCADLLALLAREVPIDREPFAHGEGALLSSGAAASKAGTSPGDENQPESSNTAAFLLCQVEHTERALAAAATFIEESGYADSDATIEALELRQSLDELRAEAMTLPETEFAVGYGDLSPWNMGQLPPAPGQPPGTGPTVFWDTERMDLMPVAWDAAHTVHLCGFDRAQEAEYLDRLRSQLPERFLPHFDRIYSLSNRIFKKQSLGVDTKRTFEKLMAKSTTERKRTEALTVYADVINVAQGTEWTVERLEEADVFPRWHEIPRQVAAHRNRRAKRNELRRGAAGPGTHHGVGGPRRPTRVRRGT